MYNQCAVTFRTESNGPSLMYPAKNWWLDETDEGGYSIAKTKFIMQVKSSEFYADIEIDVLESNKKYPSGIASCLMAGLKLIDGYELVFEDVAAQLKNGLGINIDRSVSSEIARVNEVKTNYMSIPKYKISIPNGFGFYQIAQTMTASFNEDSYVINLDIKMEHRGNKIHIRHDFDCEQWHEAQDQCIQFMKHKTIAELHDKFPEWGNDWAYLGATYFEDEKSPYEANQYVSTGFSHYAKQFAAAHNGPPKDVAKLPGVSETVKNPETGKQQKLWSAIIDLNDRRGWSRERIADWLETLDIDITFGSNSEQD